MSTVPAVSEVSLVPRPLAVAAAWGWRLIVLGAAGWIVAQSVAKLPMLVIALAVALLLTVLLNPLVRLGRRFRLPPLLTAPLVVVGFFGLAGLAIGLVVTNVAGSLSGSSQRVSEGWNRFVDWLAAGPLHVNAAQLGAWGDQAQQWVTSHASDLSQGVWTVGASATEVLAGFIVCLLVTILLLADGRRIWWQTVLLVPRRSRRTYVRAMRAGWRALSAYMHMQVVIASLEGVLIWIGAAIIGVPTAPAMGLLVFVTAFVPILGIIIAGAVCVALTFLVKGAVAALIMLAIVIVVHQAEIHLLQPWLMGHAVSLHPLVVIIGITAATLLAGFAGALFVVPLLAFTAAAIRVLVVAPASPGAGNLSAGTDQR